jgi:phosphoglycolate phosphatase-like HAD superfamily hydrolase
MRKLILFDIDGTLIRDGGAAVSAFDQAFGELFGVSDASSTVDKHGRTDLEICRDAARHALDRDLLPEEIEALQARYLDYLPGTLDDCKGYRVLPGVADLCAELARDDRVLLGLQTGNLEPAAWAKLRRGGLTDYFTFGGFGSDSADRSVLVRMAIDRGRSLAPIDASAVFVVGDAPGDILAGRRNRARTVAVGTGLTGLDALRPLKPDYVLPDLSDITRFKHLLGLTG